jgi:two-component system phosphate regulon sensor histidine kinase PhoR
MTWQERWRRSPLNRVPAKVAAVVGAGCWLLMVGLTTLAWGVALLAAGGLAAVAFVATRHWVTQRVELALTTLQQIRKHEFEDLEAASMPRGDELNTLIWQVYRTGQQLEEEIQELREMEHYRREFIGNVSHELKTPIFSVQGFAETLLDGALDDPDVNRTFVEKIMRNVNRLDNLARDLSQIARLETGQLEMRVEPFPLADLFQEVIESLEMKADEHGIGLRMRVADDLPPARGDRDRIRQVLINLTDNAIKYNSEGGYVELVAHRHSGTNGETESVKVAVVDDGVGISESHIARLTERFYRVDKSRSRNQGGTGLGLSIVKHILSAHDRELIVESTPGEGSTFGFELPAADPEPVPR